VDGHEAEITLYESELQHDLFVPFRDSTSGRESFGVGRCLEVERPGPNGRVVVDFNYAYNPYCAYNARWSCPLPSGGELNPLLTWRRTRRGEHLGSAEG
jgi:uncharacterized protein (DUF1684 family)